MYFLGLSASYIAYDQCGKDVLEVVPCFFLVISIDKDIFLWRLFLVTINFRLVDFLMDRTPLLSFHSQLLDASALIISF